MRNCIKCGVEITEKNTPIFKVFADLGYCRDCNNKRMEEAIKTYN
jgi:hypothetical protein